MERQLSLFSTETDVPFLFCSLLSSIYEAEEHDNDDDDDHVDNYDRNDDDPPATRENIFNVPASVRESCAHTHLQNTSYVYISKKSKERNKQKSF